MSAVEIEFIGTIGHHSAAHGTQVKIPVAAQPHRPHGLDKAWLGIEAPEDRAGGIGDAIGDAEAAVGLLMVGRNMGTRPSALAYAVEIAGLVVAQDLAVRAHGHGLDVTEEHIAILETGKQPRKEFGPAAVVGLGHPDEVRAGQRHALQPLAGRRAGILLVDDHARAGPPVGELFQDRHRAVRRNVIEKDHLEILIGLCGNRAEALG